MLLRCFIVILFAQFSFATLIEKKCSVEYLREFLGKRFLHFKQIFDHAGDVRMVLDTSNMSDTNSVSVLRLDYEGHATDVYGFWIPHNVDFTERIKKVYVQRIVEYTYPTKIEENIETYCNLDFIENEDVELDEKNGTTYVTLEYAKICVESVLCTLDDGNRHIKPRSTKPPVRVTDQDSLNNLFDVMFNKTLNTLKSKNSTVVPLEFNSSYSDLLYSYDLKVEKGKTNILQNLRRRGNLSLSNADLLYIVTLGFETPNAYIIARNIELNANAVGASRQFKGLLTVNLPNATFALTTSIDFNPSPCKISLEKLDWTIPEDSIGFKGTGSILGYTFPDILKTMGEQKFLDSLVKPGFVSQVNELLGQINCDEYQEMILRSLAN